MVAQNVHLSSGIIACNVSKVTFYLLDGVKNAKVCAKDVHL